MKKIIFFLFTIILLFTFSVNTFAADALYRMLHADEVESFKEDQDAIVVGQLIEKQGEKFKLKISKVISGKVSADTILLSDDFKYSIEEKSPSINDFGIFSIKKVGNYYKKAWQAYRTDSTDYKTLQIIIVKEDKLNYLGDAACIQWYVNSEGKEKDFHFNSGTAYAKKLNGEVVQVYPKQNKNDGAQTISTSIQSNENKVEQNVTEGKISRNYLLGITILILGLLIALFLKIKKGRKV